MVWIMLKTSAATVPHFVVNIMPVSYQQFCLFLSFDCQPYTIVFHNYRFRCKINKFISFGNGFRWKTSVKLCL